jgi:beta-lactamase class A
MHKLLRDFSLKKALIYVGIFVLGWSVHALWDTTLKRAISIDYDPALRRADEFAFTAPLLACATPSFTSDAYVGLEADLEKYIAGLQRTGKVTDVSVYVRDMAGRWMGINENEQYVPASLLKVPLLMAFYKQSEREPRILEKRLSYDGGTDANSLERIKSSNYIKPGSHTIRELLKAMVAYSDNNATGLLNKAIDETVLADTYTDLGLTLPRANQTSESLLSAKQFTYFFRVLYNATYLTPEHSEEALALLAESDFDRGIRAAVPKDIKIVTKFGERSIYTPQKELLERDLHDCGVVYAKEGPFHICIMTRGDDLDTQAEVIQEVARRVYEAITRMGT